ncbi:glycosyltransferase family 2 protein [Celeribacter marinus]|uniref:glycosyltransferase family 2 protein n=1 Tax=Celeribacter marinus TaxID=1397108 RepID=UPI0031787D45
MGHYFQAYMMRQLRRHLIWRSFRSRRQLTAITNRTSVIGDDAILAVSVVRNEAQRLPYFLDYYRDLGVTHFLIIDNDSDDGSTALLAQMRDVSLWVTKASYKASRFGLDWANWLLMRYCNDKWCLTVDADELFVYPDVQTRKLPDLCRFLDQTGTPAMGALMLDLYPEGPIGAVRYMAGQDPRDVLTHFDPTPYRATRQQPRGNLWLQGGARERVFFADAPEKGPTLNKLPLVRWNWRYAYINSTHSLLPPSLNALYDGPSDPRLTGVLLHTKFLPNVIEKSREEKNRNQHFRDPSAFQGYYDSIVDSPDLMGDISVPYEGVDQLESLGLMSRGAWGCGDSAR